LRLASDVSSLTAALAPPVEMAVLLDRLGIRLSFEAASDLGRHGALRHAAVGWEIVLLRRPESIQTDLSPRDRFTIAHEIGHWLIETRVGFRPHSNGEYWRLEEVCNQLAGQLLAPDEWVAELACRRFDRALDLLTEVHRLAGRCRISGEPASRRFVAFFRDVCLAEVSLLSPQTPKRLAQMFWLVDGTRRIPGTRRKLLTEEHPLADAVVAANRLSVGESASGNWVAGARDVTVKRFAYSRVHVAVLWERSTD
jgi:hypothetical protein